MLYDVHIPRCTHIKTNGTQCGSPALRGRRFCFFHKNWQGQRIQLNALPAAPLSFTMPVLEDADSVQVALMQVMRLILAGQPKTRIAIEHPAHGESSAGRCRATVRVKRRWLPWDGAQARAASPGSRSIRQTAGCRLVW
jgi:hypothetical protein